MDQLVSAEIPAPSALPRARLEAMRAAGHRILECEAALAKGRANVVSDLLRGSGAFYQWDHYPEGDVYDWDTHAQYFYHAHAADALRNLYADEHGHFHTFLRPRGFPDGVRPAPVPDFAPTQGDNDALAHLVAISMDHTGQAQRLFTTNRWVTGETWYAADDVKKLLPRFRIEHATPSWPANIWISNMLVLFGPTVEALIDARDRAVSRHRERFPDRNAFEDRDLEVTSSADISVAAQIEAIEAVLG